jgi:N-acylglucosamine 2-epimerase
VVLGLTEFARVKQDLSTLEFALKILDSIRERLQIGNIRSEPYPIPAGYEAHAISMIMLNVTQEMVNVLEDMEHKRSSELKEMSFHYMRTIMERFCREDDTIAEMISDDASKQDTMLCRHLNPGHTIECMWFVMKSAEKMGRRDYIDKAVHVIKRAFELGWDQDHGGILLYVDREGGKPRGKLTGDGFEQLIADIYNSKLWWPHSETLYSTLYAYHLSKDSELLDIYHKTHDYTFCTFPNPDKNVGEWIQIRDREGNPLKKLVALPVKDPYHILRNFLLIIELLSGEKQKL